MKFYLSVSDSSDLPPILSGPHTDDVHVPVPEGYHTQFSFSSLAEAVQEYQWFIENHPAPATK